ncbi:hypothetical protein QGP82_00005 [Leptothoe sp. LEGE 181152]|nr:hypothetical protein [Adonisia turfae]MDV3347062.1 hypothetical protein [Leptothoe sp. LEGE 181152]
MMTKKFEFEFEDYSAKNRIKFDFSEDMSEAMEIAIENGIPVIYANRLAYLMLAKAFIRMALCDYSSDFHFHIRQNFDAQREDAARFHFLESEDE